MTDCAEGGAVSVVIAMQYCMIDCVKRSGGREAMSMRGSERRGDARKVGAA